MLLLYNFLLTLSYPIFLLLTFFHSNLKKFYQTRKEGYKRIQDFLNYYQDKKKIWLHASSAGELEQALGIYRILKSKHPDIPILMTVFSLSVKNIDSLPSEGKAYLPIDFFWQWNFKNSNFICFITFTWDTFPNLLKKLKKEGCKNFLCSAAIEANSYRIKYSYFFRFFYKDFDGIGVVDKENLYNFKKVYNKTIYITGDSRYDTIYYKLNHQTLTKENKEKLKFAKDIIIFASTYKECDRQLFPYLKELLINAPKNKIWIFPHFVEKERIKEVVEYLKEYDIKDFLFYSDKNFKKKYPKYSIIIVDQLGILAYAYQYSKICYVGGAFHHRVHNTAEPAFCGCIPFTGPKIFSSPVAILLWKNQLLKKYNTGKEIIFKMIEMIKNKQSLNLQCKKIKKLIHLQLGGSLKFYLYFLSDILKKESM
jgi:3-deoxy-D-manno-octulosonic-acid transferase